NILHFEQYGAEFPLLILLLHFEQKTYNSSSAWRSIMLKAYTLKLTITPIKIALKNTNILSLIILKNEIYGNSFTF
ncbi:hypothetical protein, partial [Bacillus pseudomycoides]|uniref:hypothetical protein n=1 Tax=Bacillus pseudomycoides TaxID=64104 RepID=UPI002FFF5B60